MPWSPSDAASKTSKANTPKKARTWADVANKLYGEGAGEASAIRQANAVVARMGKK